MYERWKQSECVHKARNALSDVRIERGPLYKEKRVEHGGGDREKKRWEREMSFSKRKSHWDLTQVLVVYWCGGLFFVLSAVLAY